MSETLISQQLLKASLRRGRDTYASTPHKLPDPSNRLPFVALLTSEHQAVVTIRDYYARPRRIEQLPSFALRALVVVEIAPADEERTIRLGLQQYSVGERISSLLHRRRDGRPHRSGVEPGKYNIAPYSRPNNVVPPDVSGQASSQNSLAPPKPLPLSVPETQHYLQSFVAMELA